MAKPETKVRMSMAKPEIRAKDELGKTRDKG